MALVDGYSFYDPEFVRMAEMLLAPKGTGGTDDVETWRAQWIEAGRIPETDEAAPR